ncbi:hypothetical protein [Erythrobacter aureus]|uniref:Uncharacterized protein n=1 Tax=Erythrobacter aureus TaxID=2182384 RepID=A0A345YIS5_9SPHN|nr:hypothetical protein [Erythrobacter aureus]AXK43827.1 hypothetical protein DVR09_15335 [Erythrobacter aureus]
MGRAIHTSKPIDRTGKYSGKDARRVSALLSKLDSELEAERDLALNALVSKMVLSDFIGIIRFAAYSLGYSQETTTKWLHTCVDQSMDVGQIVDNLHGTMADKSVRWSDILTELPIADILDARPVQCLKVLAR